MRCDELEEEIQGPLEHPCPDFERHCQAMLLGRWRDSGILTGHPRLRVPPTRPHSLHREGVPGGVDLLIKRDDLYAIRGSVSEREVEEVDLRLAGDDISILHGSPSSQRRSDRELLPVYAASEDSTPAVATQDVVFLLTRLLSNPAARERTWRFVQSRWAKLAKRMPPLLASRLVESTWWLLTAEHRREVARHFAAHPLPSGERALRQTLERFDWYRGFRRDAAKELRSWLEGAAER